MPIYEFRCLDCGKLFERLFVGSDDAAELRCPHCKAENCHRVVSRTNYAMASSGGAKPSITTKRCGGGNQCMTLDLPGHTRE